jgi:hypothetical protein
MAAFRSVSVDAQSRARRWDAIVLGSGVASLVTAARLGMRELRVLILEEPACAELPLCMREPPLFSSPGDAFETVLRELRVALIDRRRFSPRVLAHQVVGPGLRVDIGGLEQTANELVTWGFAKPNVATALIESLDQAAQSEGDHLFQSPLVRAPRLLGLGRGGAPPRGGTRGLPPEVAAVDPNLGRLLAAQIRGLGNHAEAGPSSESCARRLGAGLQGGLTVKSGAPSLIPILRRRVEALYGEFRTVDDFQLVTANGLPGIYHEESKELLLGGALIIGCAPTPLARALGDEKLARTLGARTPGAHRRLALHWRIPRTLLPEGLESPLIALTRPDADDPQEGIVTLNVTTSESGEDEYDLIARTLLAADESEADADSRVSDWLHTLIPFATEKIVRCQHVLPSWDGDDWLEAQPLGREWPGEGHFRVGQRPPVYRLDRPAIAGLGLEGDLLLGWRAGDAIAEDMT